MTKKIHTIWVETGYRFSSMVEACQFCLRKGWRDDEYQIGNVEPYPTDGRDWAVFQKGWESISCIHEHDGPGSGCVADHKTKEGSIFCCEIGGHIVCGKEV
jgi:hypothetical protein